MSVLTAARAVLDDAREPLAPDEIYLEMVDRGLWRNPHEHPGATVAAAIRSDIGRRSGDSAFVSAGPRAFASRAASGR
jgi:HB1/ASXL restriction endonuclease-like protein with HTH domain